MATVLDTIPQAAAIPLREDRVCLVKSRSGKRWVIPKGCLERGKSAGEIALQEAWEEAGLTGVLTREPIGSYLYEKYGNWHHVTVFLMYVSTEAKCWPESDWRRRIWIPADRAVERIDDDGLRELFRGMLPK